MFILFLRFTFDVPFDKTDYVSLAITSEIVSRHQSFEKWKWQCHRKSIEIWLTHVRSFGVIVLLSDLAIRLKNELA